VLVTCYHVGMKPTIGRIVHYHPCVCRDASDPDTSPIPLVTYAALVVDVHRDGTPILRVFPDAGDSYIVDCGINGYNVDGVTRTDEPAMGHWNWPPRE